MLSRLPFVLCATMLACSTQAPIAEPEPLTEDVSYALGFTEEELSEIWSMSDVDMPLDPWLETQEGTFNCLEYGDLCVVVGLDAAESLVQESYDRLLAGESVDGVQAWFEDAVQVASEAHAEHEDANDNYRAYNQSFNTQGNRRTRVRGYNIKPPVPFSGYAYAQCQHQRRWSTSQPWFAVVANNRASIRSRRVTDYLYGRDFNGPPIPSASGYTQNQATGLLVVSGSNYHGPGPWSDFSGSSIDDFITSIKTRACCQTFNAPGFNDNVWCVGNTNPI